jgi:predicted transcriptional regulator
VGLAQTQSKSFSSQSGDKGVTKMSEQQCPDCAVLQAIIRRYQKEDDLKAGAIKTLLDKVESLEELMHKADGMANEINTIAAEVRVLAKENVHLKEILSMSGIQVLEDGSHQFKPKAVKQYCGEQTQKRIESFEKKLTETGDVVSRLMRKCISFEVKIESLTAQLTEAREVMEKAINLISCEDIEPCKGSIRCNGCEAKFILKAAIDAAGE